jgi:hypothetical protein
VARQVGSIWRGPGAGPICRPPSIGWIKNSATAEIFEQCWREDSNFVGMDGA